MITRINNGFEEYEAVRSTLTLGDQLRCKNGSKENRDVGSGCD